MLARLFRSAKDSCSAMPNTSNLAGEVIEEMPMDPLWGHAINWCIAVGPGGARA